MFSGADTGGECQRTVGHLMRQEVAVQRVVGEKPSLMNQVARRANDSGGSLGNERDVHARERQILKTGIVGQKDGGEHTRT